MNDRNSNAGGNAYFVRNERDFFCLIEKKLEDQGYILVETIPRMLPAHNEFNFSRSY